jgi:diguanylate cyclase (GGDEF)-like protein
MELLFWKLSTAAQVVSAVMIAVVFPFVTRAFRSREQRLWTFAWLMNGAAIMVAAAFWALRPPLALYPLVRALYVVTKSSFLLLLMQGTWAAIRDGGRAFGSRTAAALLGASAVAAAFVLDSVDKIGVAEQLLIGLAMGACALVAGCAVRALTGLVESGAYVAHMAWTPAGGEQLGTLLSTFLAAHSIFDVGVEWLVALGCVHALSDRGRRELRARNDELRAQEAEARRLAGRDTLTGLPNRRALERALDSASATGATLLLFDIDGFKEINDTFGHHAGDECLRGFADALRECFDGSGECYRYAGDEFVVVSADAITSPGLAARLNALGRKLEKGAGGMSIGFSVGMAALERDGDADGAVREADLAMYRSKAERRAAGRTAPPRPRLRA